MTVKNRDFITCIRASERLFYKGQRKLAAKRLEEALLDLKRPMQRLPAWVVPGVEVRTTGSPPNHVYKVFHVDRSKPEWRFVGEWISPGGTKYLMSFRREAGKRYWERHRPTTPDKQIPQPTSDSLEKAG